ncbi:MAG: CotH kinase family protein [Firmicutes bacterium]|nr:CotH kinase family protein [Bacillota bacterium]
MTSFKVKILILVLSIAAVMIPLTVFADDADTNDHQHSPKLIDVTTGNIGADIPYCGRFFCKDCHSFYYDSLTPDDLGMPIMDISGSLDGVSKTVKKTVSISYMSGDGNFESDATIKWQGGSSIYYPKKNFTIQFIKSSGSKNKVAIVDAWGKQSKYCLKANYIDYSQSRNVVSGRIFNEIVHSRGIDDELNALPNGGVVDGYPVALYLNGKYLGLYTLNIPKDKWMFGMKDETLRQALMFGDDWKDSVFLRQPITDVNNVESSGWELEYCSTEDDPAVGTAWVAESMNEFIAFLNANDGEAFKAGISQYTDVDRAIDVMLYTYFIHANDNVAKNIVWATYDGVRWIPSVYDMDGTWGMYWDGSLTLPANDFTPAADNLLFKRLLDNCSDEILARYVQLRETVLSRDNLRNHFEAFFDSVSSQMYKAERIKWKDVPNNDVDQQQQILDYIDARTEFMDSYYGVTIPDPNAPPEKPAIAKVKVGKKKLTVNMNADPASVGAMSYQIAYRVKGTSKWKTVSTDQQSLVIKNLKSGKKYQVRARSCKTTAERTLNSKWTKITISKKIK